MKLLEKLDKANTYISFNVFTICGWLYVPILFNYIHNYTFGGYFLFIGLFLLIPWIITVIAFIIFLIELSKTNHLTNNFCVKNIYFKIFKYIGLLITVLFYLTLIFYNPYNFS